jgi:hypothetical protein
MEQKNVFELSHVVLWLKGWYDHTEDKWKDLATMLNLDGHPGYKSKEDITRCLVYYYNECLNINLPNYSCCYVLSVHEMGVAYMAVELVDYENVFENGLAGIDLLKNTDTFEIFYSEPCKNIRRECLDIMNIYVR